MSHHHARVPSLGFLARQCLSERYLQKASFLCPLQLVSLSVLRFSFLILLLILGVAGLTGSKYRRSFLSDRTRRARVSFPFPTDAGRQILRFERQNFFDPL